jgi:dienelactone hydrolase
VPVDPKTDVDARSLRNGVDDLSEHPLRDLHPCLAPDPLVHRSRRVENELHVYPGAPHSFFDRKQEEFAAESEDAWSRVLAFLETAGGQAKT